MSNSLDHFISFLPIQKPLKLVVAAAHDITVLKAIQKATDINYIEPILIGSSSHIRNICNEIEFDIEKFEIVNSNSDIETAEKSVSIICSGNADIIMKGLIPTAIFLKPILSKENNLLSGKVLSQFAIAELPYYHKIIGIADAAINISPGVEEKIEIINNSVSALQKLGINNPKVALICPIEKENPKIESTIQAAKIKKIWQEGKIQNCIIDGPLALDNALSKEASNHKNIKSNVAGDADLLIAPNLDAGNILYKSITYIAGGTTAAVVLGAKFPIILTSRSDSVICKYNSIALAKMMTND